jgi:hypothetical protein
MTNEQTEIAKPDTQTEIVIRSQAELDKLLKQTYNRKLKRCVIDKSLKLEITDNDSWAAGSIPASFSISDFVAFFKQDVECRNIYAPDIAISSLSNIEARTIIAQNIDYVNELNARHIYSINDVRAKTINAWTIRAKNIESDSITICSHHYEYLHANITKHYDK